MGKVVKGILKVVAVVAGAVFLGPQGAALVLAGISVIEKATGSKAKSVGASTGLTSRVSIDPDIADWIVIGETALPTQLIYFGTSGSTNQNLSMIFVHACHPIAGFSSLNLNNVATAFPTPSGAYAGILSIQTADGNQTANPFTSVNGGEWGATHIGRGRAMSHFRWTYDQEKLASGLPQNIQFVAKGIRVYDPRRDSTRGGSGSHRANDETTWAYQVSADAIGRNPALVELSYRLGWCKNGRLWAGMGEDPANIDYASYIASANVCDETVNGKPRYRIDGLLSLGDVHNLNLGKIAATCGGKATDAGGLIGFWVAHDDTAVAVMTITDSEWVGDIAWAPLPDGEVRNTARGSFIDPANFYQAQPYLEVKPSDLIALDNGEELADTLDFAMVQDPDQARRLASIRLRESRQGRLTGPAALKTLGLRPTNVVSVVRPRTGWAARRFRVETMGLTIDQTQLALRAVQSSDYTDIANASVASAGSLPTIGYVPVLGVLAFKDFVDFATEVTGSAKPENNADVTANATPLMTVPPTTTIRFDYTGTALTDELPRTLIAKRYKGGVDVTSSGTTWAITAAGCSASINSDGQISITACTAAGSLTITSDRDGVLLTGQTNVLREDGAAPSSGGSGGGTSVSDSTLGSTASSTYTGTALGGPMTVKPGSGGVISLSANLAFIVSTASPAGSFGLYLKWRWRIVGGSFADAGSEAGESGPCVITNEGGGFYTREDGSISCNRTVTGLTPGADYEVQLEGRTPSGTRSRGLVGTVSAVGS